MTVTKTLHTQHTQHQHSVALVKDHFLAAAASTFSKSPKILIPAASVPESEHRRWHASWDGHGWVFSTSIYLTVNYLKYTATCTKHPDSRPDPEPLFWEERWKAGTLAETLDRDRWGKKSNRDVFLVSYKLKRGNACICDSIDKLKRNSLAFWYQLSDSKKCLFFELYHELCISCGNRKRYDFFLLSN